MKKVILCGTHPEQFNGYSKVVYELSRYLGGCADVKLYVFGFQNFYDNQAHRAERLLPANVEVYDVYANENPKAKGFGEALINDYIIKVQPDVLIIYNDLLVINSLLKKIQELPMINFRIVPYVDLVYKNEKQSLLMNINMLVDSAIMFTEYWRDVAHYQGFTKPMYVLEHGFNPESYYPIPKKLGRKFFNISEQDFVIVNLNRNQPRKRWDLCMMSYIKFISNHMGENIRLLIATSMNGGWDLGELIMSECRKYKIDVAAFQKHIIMLQNPQQITDFDINIMYNLGDIGINTCDGEGFGLCNFEQAGVGVAQIVPNIGGFRDFFRKNETALMIEPCTSYYCDHGRDYVGGEPEVCNVSDFADALEYYYTNRDVAKAHGDAARKHILEHYKWSDIGKKLYDIVSTEANILYEKMRVVNGKTVQMNPTITLQELDINELINGGGEANEKPSDKEEKTDKTGGNIEYISDNEDNKETDIDNMSFEEMKKMLKQMIKK